MVIERPQNGIWVSIFEPPTDATKTEARTLASLLSRALEQPASELNASEKQAKKILKTAHKELEEAEKSFKKFGLSYMQARVANKTAERAAHDLKIKNAKKLVAFYKAQIRYIAYAQRANKHLDEYQKIYSKAKENELTRLMAVQYMLDAKLKQLVHDARTDKKIDEEIKSTKIELQDINTRLDELKGVKKKAFAEFTSEIQDQLLNAKEQKFQNNIMRNAESAVKYFDDKDFAQERKTFEYRFFNNQPYVAFENLKPGDWTLVFKLAASDNSDNYKLINDLKVKYTDFKNKIEKNSELSDDEKLIVNEIIEEYCGENKKDINEYKNNKSDEFKKEILARIPVKLMQQTDRQTRLLLAKAEIQYRSARDAIADEAREECRRESIEKLFTDKNKSVITLETCKKHEHYFSKLLKNRNYKPYVETDKALENDFFLYLQSNVYGNAFTRADLATRLLPEHIDRTRAEIKLALDKSKAFTFKDKYEDLKTLAKAVFDNAHQRDYEIPKEINDIIKNVHDIYNEGAEGNERALRAARDFRAITEQKVYQHIAVLMQEEFKELNIDIGFYDTLDSKVQSDLRDGKFNHLISDQKIKKTIAHQADVRKFRYQDELRAKTFDINENKPYVNHSDIERYKKIHSETKKLINVVEHCNDQKKIIENGVEIDQFHDPLYSALLRRMEFERDVSGAIKVSFSSPEPVVQKIQVEHDVSAENKNMLSWAVDSAYNIYQAYAPWVNNEVSDEQSKKPIQNTVENILDDKFTTLISACHEGDFTIDLNDDIKNKLNDKISKKPNVAISYVSLSKELREAIIDVNREKLDKLVFDLKNRIEDEIASGVNDCKTLEKNASVKAFIAYRNAEHANLKTKSLYDLIKAKQQTENAKKDYHLAEVGRASGLLYVLSQVVGMMFLSIIILSIAASNPWLLTLTILMLAWGVPSTMKTNWWLFRGHVSNMLIKIRNILTIVDDVDYTWSQKLRMFFLFFILCVPAGFLAAYAFYVVFLGGAPILAGFLGLTGFLLAGFPIVLGVFTLLVLVPIMIGAAISITLIFYMPDHDAVLREKFTDDVLSFFYALTMTDIHQIDKTLRAYRAEIYQRKSLYYSEPELTRMISQEVNGSIMGTLLNKNREQMLNGQIGKIRFRIGFMLFIAFVFAPLVIIGAMATQFTAAPDLTKALGFLGDVADTITDVVCMLGGAAYTLLFTFGIIQTFVNMTCDVSQSASKSHTTADKTEFQVARAGNTIENAMGAGVGVVLKDAESINDFGTELNSIVGNAAAITGLIGVTGAAAGGSFITLGFKSDPPTFEEDYNNAAVNAHLTHDNYDVYSKNSAMSTLVAPQWRKMESTKSTLTSSIDSAYPVVKKM